MPEEDQFKIIQFLLKEILNISISTDAGMDRAWRTMTDKQSTKINAALLPITGIGEDLFFLNEYFQKGKNILSFDTLYDYDFDDYTFQENTRKESQENYQIKAYKGNFHSSWARLIIDDSFSYAMLTMTAMHIYDKLDEFGYDYIEKLIPHEFKRGLNHGRPEKAGYLYDMKIDANGLEPQLEELKHRFFNYLNSCSEILLNEFDNQPDRYIYILNESTINNPSHHFLFSNKDVLKSIHFKSFMRDCRSLERKNHTYVSHKIEEEKQRLIAYLDLQYKDIMEKFNPEIIKLKKKRKVIFHKDSGLDELFD